LLAGEDGLRLSLAGAYPELSPKFAMKIGKLATLADLNIEAWAAFAIDTGVGLPLIK
jgi:serine/threonine-protein kinase HipA